MEAILFLLTVILTDVKGLVRILIVSFKTYFVDKIENFYAVQGLS